MPISPMSDVCCMFHVFAYVVSNKYFDFDFDFDFDSSLCGQVGGEKKRTKSEFDL